MCQIQMQGRQKFCGDFQSMKNQQQIRKYSTGEFHIHSKKTINKSTNGILLIDFYQNKSYAKVSNGSKK